MQKTYLTLGPITLVGLTCRTTNEAESIPSTAKIAPLVQRYFQNGWAHKIPNRQTPGMTYITYTAYEGDHTQAYTCFIGEAVENPVSLTKDLESLSIPPQKYMKLTSGPDKIPDVSLKAWQTVWKSSPTDLGGERAYQTDFEIWGEKACDPEKAIIDLYIGLKKTSS